MSRKKRTIVIKIGSSCIVQENGRVNLSNLAELSESQMIRSIETFDFLEELSLSIKPYGKYANLRSKLKAAEIAAYRKVKTVIT